MGGRNLDIDLGRMNEELERATPQEILAWGWENFGPRMALLSSFGTESVVLLHMVSRVAPQMEILFLETGFHFKETLEYKSLLTRLFSLNVRDLAAEMPRSQFVERYGEDLYNRDPDRCCEINKVEPLQKALKGLQAWVSGIRRAQGPTRQNVNILERYELAGSGSEPTATIYKLNPLTYWTSKDTWHYTKEHNLPFHPLYEKGYTSIGCWPCTRSVLPGEEERAGRWANRVKSECGIHTFMKPKSK